MKTKLQTGFAAITLLLFAACTRENGLIKPVGPAATDTTTTTPPADSTYKGPVTNNYQPDSSGSTWTYQVHQVFNIGQSTIGQLFPQEASVFSAFKMDTTIVYHVAALNTTAQAGGLTFQQYSNDYGGGIYSPAIALSQGVYTGVDQVWGLMWIGGSSFGGFSLNDDTLTYLEDKPVGTSWSQTTVIQDGLGFEDTTSYAFTIKARGLTKVVNGINYPNVIQVESTTIPSALQSFTVLLSIQGVNLNTTTEYYYAENVGLIEEDLSNPFLGITVNASLVNSNIR
ncbi:hypothetical protein [Dinghuibacter silviterrae]|uniref:Lipoprotein n=1 Tax=Dinghuibacter silviterrae TaxID=1539049 RepID=A0A4R8DG28_9BACT|nr:hypothetical protein [Dinghuibacter silviterrae]TDW96204.1 hypothetical protein EDB95_4029 [Dinghuibacter silviterrae]